MLSMYLLVDVLLADAFSGVCISAYVFSGV